MYVFLAFLSKDLNQINDMIQYLHEITWKLIILSNNTIGGILKSKTKNWKKMKVIKLITNNFHVSSGFTL